MGTTRLLGAHCLKQCSRLARIHDRSAVHLARHLGRRKCDQDTSERGESRETGQDRMASSAEASMEVSDRPGRIATARGLLIPQRSRVQIPSPLPGKMGVQR